MIISKEVTNCAPRESHHPNRHIDLRRLTQAPFGTLEHEKWIKENWWMVNYSVFMGNAEKAKGLARELDLAFRESPTHPSIPSILEKLKELQVPDKLSALETWTHSGYALATYCGDRVVLETITKCLSKYRGEVLEAMCGHFTYFERSRETNVTALDYCEVSLERYPVPERKRILCDLNQLKGDGETLPFFEDEQFDAVSICFGYKYPENMDYFAEEMWRILKKGGVLSFIENPKSGYQDLCKRTLSEFQVKNILSSNGFRSVTMEPLTIPDWEEYRGKFFHIEATK